MYGGDVSGAPSMDDFIGALKSSGPYEKHYNSWNPNYYDELIRVHELVEEFAKLCGVNLNPYK